jgi:hypothetical protein
MLAEIESLRNIINDRVYGIKISTNSRLPKGYLRQLAESMLQIDINKKARAL